MLLFVLVKYLVAVYNGGQTREELYKCMENHMCREKMIQHLR